MARRAFPTLMISQGFSLKKKKQTLLCYAVLFFFFFLEQGWKMYLFEWETSSNAIFSWLENAPSDRLRALNDVNLYANGDLIKGQRAWGCRFVTDSTATDWYSTSLHISQRFTRKRWAIQVSLISLTFWIVQEQNKTTTTEKKKHKPEFRDAWSWNVFSC